MISSIYVFLQPQKINSRIVATLHSNYLSSPEIKNQRYHGDSCYSLLLRRSPYVFTRLTVFQHLAPLTLTSNKSGFFISRGVKTVGSGALLKAANNIATNSLEKTHLVRSTFHLFNSITNSRVIAGVHNNDPQPLLENAINYVTSTGFGNVQMKTNYLTGVLSDKIPLSALHDAYKIAKPLSRIRINNQNSGYFSARGFAEIGIIHEHERVHAPHINDVVVTADQIVVASKSQPNPDYLLTYQHEIFGVAQKTRYYDCKSGNAMIDRPFGGTIGQLTYYGEEQLTTPNNFIDLFAFNKKRQSLLENKQREIMCDPQMSKKEADIFEREYLLFSNIIVTPETILENYSEIERILYRIQTLPNFNKAISFINIIKNPVDGDPMSSAELAFVKAVFSRLPDNVFSNPRTLRKYLQMALEIYKVEVNRKSVIELSKTKDLVWMPSFLDGIDISVFS